MTALMKRIIPDLLCVLERDLYPTHTRAQLKDEETKVEDAKDQYD